MGEGRETARRLGREQRETACKDGGLFWVVCTPAHGSFRLDMNIRLSRSFARVLRSFLRLRRAGPPDKAAVLRNIKPEPVRHNLTTRKRHTLKSLYKRNDIVIKSADKGSATVVMEAETGINKCLRQLNNTKFYRPLDNDITYDIKERVQVKVEHMLRDKILDDDTKRFLIQSNSKPARFYILPKIHNPGRPIVSSNSNPSERVSQFVHHHLKIHSTHKRHFVNKLEHLRQLPENAFLVTLDVSSLCTNIPHNEGIRGRKFWCIVISILMPQITIHKFSIQTLIIFLLRNSLVSLGYLWIHATATLHPSVLKHFVTSYAWFSLWTTSLSMTNITYRHMVPLWGQGWLLHTRTIFSPNSRRTPCHVPLSNPSHGGVT